MPEGTHVDSGSKKRSNVKKLDALIIGAGFSGLYQLMSLRDKLGLSVKVVEAGDGVGGTWYWNRYPGARCDSESHSYSYYFSDELLEEWEWSERYPGHAEVVRYLNFVADKLNLKKDIQFNLRVSSARYDEENNSWKVQTEQGDCFECTYLITAVGCLSSTNIPHFPGHDTFQGDWYHTGKWPHEGVDFTGKRVGQIGTGSTGIQAVPVIADTAEHLTVFQRTANYSVPAQNGPLSQEFQDYLREHRSQIKETIRTTPNGHTFVISERKVFDVDEDEREAIFEAAWEKGGLGFRACFQDIAFDKKANDVAADFIKKKIKSIVNDPKTAELLTDIDHPYATKRPPIDTNYFETFNRDNVSLVDVRSDPIECITPKGVKTANGEYEVDILVFATGFDAMTGPLLNLNIEGKSGQKLEDIWNAGPKTYLGIQIPGFPNLFTITGPGSPSVLCNMPVAIEQHVEWITDCISFLEDNEISTIEATIDSMDKWVSHVNDCANVTLMPYAKHTWYYGANIPGKPRVFMPYAGGMARYRAICDDIANKNYIGFRLGKTENSTSWSPPSISVDDLVEAAMVRGPAV
ncbi:MAG: cyclohexanone monooxygenase [Rhodospirillaceae bacterium]|nr:cyclohexanone monooxygenase [Rhodospirillaceae bacterium]|tara:strand:- start:171 stop:1901 length:1731 start_codon:yes stop_codon:yes gene_type:complete